MRRTVLFALALSVVTCRAAAAQDTPRLGIVMGYPAQLGVLWTVSDRVALRPQIDASRGASESTTTTNTIVGIAGLPTISTTTVSSSSNWSVGTGVAALIYLSRRDALRTYVAPGFTYSRSSSTVQSTVTISSSVIPVPPISSGGPTTTHASNYTTTGAFGAQYTLATHFGLFGELGLAYVHSGELPTFAVGTIAQRDASNWSLAMRSGVGVMLFF
jgi:hypothetical protein